MIYVVPMGGLCNRMRVINSVYKLFGDKKRITVLWAVNDECAISSKELFTLPDKIKILNFSHYDPIMRRLWTLFYKACRFLCHKNLINQEYTNEIRDDKDKIEQAFAAENIFFESCSDLLTLMPCDIFTPIPQIQEQVKNIIGSKNFDSMHIRRTDNAPSIEGSSNDAFERTLQKLTEQNRQVFLATDDENLKSYLLQKYPDTVFSNESIPLSRKSKEGMQAAYCDLLCLSEGETIYGSYYSSFTDVASCIKGARLVIVRD